MGSGRKENARRVLCALRTLALLAALVLCPEGAVEGGKTGLALCGGVVIPSLFPYLVVSALVVKLGLASALARAAGPVMGPLFGVGGACAPALVLGLLGGYPVGARTASELCRAGLCSKDEANRLLAFCNNSGPAFLLGVVGAGVFRSPSAGALLYGVHAAAALLTGLLFRCFGKSRPASPAPSAPQPRQAAPFDPAAAFTSAVAEGAAGLMNICAFVVFFAVLLSMLKGSGLLDGMAAALAAVFGPLGLTKPWALRLLTGLLELSSGVWSLADAGLSVPALTLAAFLLGWGGVSVLFQTFSVLGDSGLSPAACLKGKAVHGVLSALLVRPALRLFPAALEAFSPAAPAGTAGARLALFWGWSLLPCAVCFFVCGIFLRNTSRKRRKDTL